MKQHVRIGVVCLARETFDVPAAVGKYKEIQRDLKNVGEADFKIIEQPVIEVEQARRAARVLAAARIDGLIVISGTFHLGHLILELRREITCPVLLWGLEELPYDGGKIRLNSVCGVNLNASNLYKAGVDNYHYLIGSQVDQDWIDALRIVKLLKRARVGLVGYRAHGFFNLGVDELDTYRQLGFLLDHFELAEIYNYPVDEETVREKGEKLTAVFAVDSLSEEQLAQTAGLAARIEALMRDYNLTALAVRCWPEFAANYGIAPCAAMSLLQSEGRITACEGDVEGAVSMLAHRAVGAETPFLADLSQIDISENYALMWHCGVAPCNLWDGCCTRSLDTYFAGGRGVTADFVLKSGEVSILRLDSARGNYRLLLQKGEARPMEKQLKGTYARVSFERNIQGLLDLVITNGIAHHVSLVYGDYIRPFEILAGIKGWPVIK